MKGISFVHFNKFKDDIIHFLSKGEKQYYYKQNLKQRVFKLDLSKIVAQ